MKQQNQKQEKILFRFYSGVLDQWTVETLWSEKINAETDYYKIESIPFYASIAYHDIVFAEYDDTEKMLTYRETIKYSGNSTIQVVIMDKAFLINPLREIFNEIGCNSEQFSEAYFVVNVPANQNYQSIKNKLVDLQNKDIIDFAESCLSEKHYF